MTGSGDGNGSINGPPPDPESIPSTSGLMVINRQQKHRIAINGDNSAPTDVNDRIDDDEGCEDVPDPSPSHQIKQSIIVGNILCLNLTNEVWINLDEKLTDINRQSSDDPPRVVVVGEHGYFSDDDDEEDDDDYVPPEPWKKQIRIGDDYQAFLPDMYNSRLDDDDNCPPIENIVVRQLDLLLWRIPDQLSTEQGLSISGKCLNELTQNYCGVLFRLCMSLVVVREDIVVVSLIGSVKSPSGALRHTYCIII